MAAIYDGTNRGTSLLKELFEHSAIGALYNSKERYDPPKCHPETREEIRQDIVDWTERDEPSMLWLYGSAGAGKSAIAQSITEYLAACKKLAASFFFSRTSGGSQRDNEERFIFTIALQLAENIPGFALYVEEAIMKTPSVWGLSLTSQASTLILEPLKRFQHADDYPRVIIVDGLDECRQDNNGQEQVLGTLRLLSDGKSGTRPFKVFVASRPEYIIKTWFDLLLDTGSDSQEQLQMLCLDLFTDSNDIRRFFQDETTQIVRSHPLRHRIPLGWPSEPLMEEMVRRAGDHFIYAATLIKYIKSPRYVPSKRLEYILDQTIVKNDHPFADLDRRYLEILRNTDNLDVTLSVLALYIVLYFEAPHMFWLERVYEDDMAALLGFPDLDFDLLFFDLGSIIDYPLPLDTVFLPFKIHHTSLLDFLRDSGRAEDLALDIKSASQGFLLEALRRVYEAVENKDNHPRMIWFWNVVWQLCWKATLTPEIKSEFEKWNTLHDDAIEHVVNNLSFLYSVARPVFFYLTSVDSPQEEDSVNRVESRGGCHLHPLTVRVLRNAFAGRLQSKLQAYLDCPDLPVELLALVAVHVTTGGLLRGTSLLSDTQQEFERKLQLHPNKEEIFYPFLREGQRRNYGWTHILRFLYYWDIPGAPSFSPTDFTAATIYLLKHIIIRHLEPLQDQGPRSLERADYVLEAHNDSEDESHLKIIIAVVALEPSLSRSSLSIELTTFIQETRILDSISHVTFEWPEHIGNSSLFLLKSYVQIHQDLSNLFTDEGSTVIPGGLTLLDLENMQVGEAARRVGLGEKYGESLDIRYHDDWEPE